MKVPFLDLKAQYESIKPEIDAAIAAVVADTAFISGKYARAFEADFAAYLGVPHCVGVGNGTDALFLSLKALDIGPGDEVLVAGQPAAGQGLSPRRGRPQDHSHGLQPLRSRARHELQLVRPDGDDR